MALFQKKAINIFCNSYFYLQVNSCFKNLVYFIIGFDLHVPSTLKIRVISSFKDSWVMECYFAIACKT